MRRGEGNYRCTSHAHRHTDSQELQLTLNNGDRTNVYVYINQGVTTGKPASDRLRRLHTHTHTHTHTHAEREMETLPKALGHSAEQSQPPKNLHRTTMEKTEEKSSVLVRQHFVLHKTRSLLQYLCCPMDRNVILDH